MAEQPGMYGRSIMPAIRPTKPLFPYMLTCEASERLRIGDIALRQNGFFRYFSSVGDNSMIQTRKSEYL